MGGMVLFIKDWSSIVGFIVESVKIGQSVIFNGWMFLLSVFSISLNHTVANGWDGFIYKRLEQSVKRGQAAFFNGWMFLL
jgi:hypothetical protein